MLINVVHAEERKCIDLSNIDRSAFINSDARYMFTERGLSVEQAIQRRNELMPLLGVSNFGIVYDTLWISFSICNTNPVNQSYSLFVNSPLLDRVNLYVRHENALSYNEGGGSYELIMRGGDHVPLDKYVNPYAEPIVDLSLPGNEQIDYLLMVETNGGLYVPITLMERTNLEPILRFKNSVYGVYFGIVFALLLYNSFLWTSTGNRNFFYYILFIASYSAFVFFNSGYSYQFVLFSGAQDNLTFTVGARYLYILTMVLFVKKFCQTKLRDRKVDFFLTIVLVADFCMLLLFFYGEQRLAVSLAALNSLIACCFVLYIAIRGLFRKDAQASFLFFSWLILLVGGIIFNLGLINVISRSTLTEYTYIIGSGLDALLISFALTARLNAQLKSYTESDEDRRAQLQKQADKMTSALRRSHARLRRSNQLLESRREALSKRKRESLQARERKETLYNEIDHHIRQPLNTLYFSSYVLMQRLAKDRMSSIVDKVITGVEIIDSMLSSSLGVREAAKKLDDKKTRVSEILLAVVGGVQDLLSRYSTTINSQSNVAEIPFIRDDIQRIMLNFVSNAVAHGRASKITIYCTYASDIQSKKLGFFFGVSDDGRGMIEAERERIVGALNNDDNSSAIESSPEVFEHARDHQRLGLVICKRLCRRMNAAVYCYSVQGKGSLFGILIPSLQSPQELSLNAEGDLSQNQSLPNIVLQERAQLKGTILLIDDDKSIVDSMTEVLRQWGLDVVSFHTLYQARRFALCNHHEISVVVTDYRIESDKEDGLGFARWIRAEVRASLPILIISGNYSRVQPMLVDSDKGVELLAKPIDPDELYTHLYALIN